MCYLGYRDVGTVWSILFFSLIFKVVAIALFAFPHPYKEEK